MEKRKAYWKADQRNPKIKSAFTLYLKTHCAGSESFSGNGNVFINDEKCFLFSLNSSFYPFFHYNFCPDFFGLVVKQLDNKTNVNFKFYDAN